MPQDAAKLAKAFPLRDFAVMATAMAVGIAAVLGYFAFQDQQDQIAALSEIIVDLQQGGAAVPTVDVVSRNATSDLNALANVVNASAPVEPRELTGAERLEQLMAETGIVFEPGDLCFFDGTHDAAP